MYLHLGQHYVINPRDIVMIAEYGDQIQLVNCEQPTIFIDDIESIKSIIITHDRIYYSAFSRQNLQKKMYAIF